MGGLNPAHVPYWRVNNPTLWDFCVSMIGRADIEGSKSNVAMNVWHNKFGLLAACLPTGGHSKKTRHQKKSDLSKNTQFISTYLSKGTSLDIYTCIYIYIYVYMYIQNALHIVQAWIIKYHPNIGSGTVSMLLKSPNKMRIHTTVFETSQPSLSFWGRERAGVAGQSTQWRAFSFCFAPWKHDKSQDKNWSASTRAMEDSSLYIFERHLDWSPKPNASSRRRLVPCSRRGGLQIWTTDVAG